MKWGAHKTDVRIAAKNSVTVRAALRVSINAGNIWTAYQDTHPYASDNISQDRARARAWAMLHVKIDYEAIEAALKKVYTDGFLIGLDASKEVITQGQKEYNKAAITKSEESDYVDWSNWKPGNRAAALLYRPTGAFEKLLNNAGIVSKKIAADGFDRIGTALADSVAAGFSPARAAKVITEKIGDPARALTIAITEQNRAMSLASMQNYKEYGVEKVEWSGANPCEICAPNEGQVVALGDNFNSGDTEPPVHPNCRCAVLPVIDEAYYAETGNEGLDLVPMEEAAPNAEETIMTADEVIGYQRSKGFMRENEPQKQVEAAIYYKGAAYKQINEWLRTGEVSDYRVVELTPKLDALIAKAPALPAPITTYRGVYGNYADTMRKFTPGTIYSDKGFSSTTLDKKVTETFSSLANREKHLVIQVEVPAGGKGMDIAGFFNAKNPRTGNMVKGEQEWLLPRDSKFEVISVEGNQMKVRLLP